MTMMLTAMCLTIGAGALMPSIIAYRPFLDPINVDRYWLVLLAPLVLVISIVYKTIKLQDLSVLPRHAAVLAAQIMAFMVLAAAALWLMSEVF